METINTQIKNLSQTLSLPIATEFRTHDSGFEIEYKQQSIGSNQKIEVNTIQNHIVLYSEIGDIQGRPDIMSNIIEIIARINDFIQIGCLEIIPESNKFRFKTGQIIHPTTNYVPLFQYFIDYHSLIIPKISSVLKEVIISGKPPIEAANLFYAPTEPNNKSKPS